MRLLVIFLLSFFFMTVKAQNLVIATVPFNPPFESAADSSQHYFGFDIEIMTAVCQEMQVNCTFKTMPFNEIFKALQNGEADLAIASITIDPDRSKYFLFSLPYMTSKARFMALGTSDIVTIEDFRNKTIGIIRHTNYTPYIRQTFGDEATIKRYKITEEMMNALVKGEVHGILTNEESAQYWSANDSKVFKLVGDKITCTLGYGIMARKDNVNLINRVNHALKDIEQNNTYISIYRKYFGI